MTSKTTTLTQKREELERFPDYPPRDDMQNWLYLYETAVVTTLVIHYANEPNVTVASEVPVGPSLPVRADARIPDLMFVRDGDRALMEEQRGYAIDRQGKAPDFVLEVASPTTGRADYTDKRRDYERFGVTEYWRFDPSGGEYHDVALAGDRLVGGAYEPIEIEVLGEGRLRGYSEALGLYVCWEEGMLRFFDPGTESYLGTHEEERAARMAAQAGAGTAENRAREEEAARLAAQARAGTAENRAETAEARAREEEAARMAAQTRAEEERAARLAAESRLAEFEAELRRLRGE
ncbi:MAG: Uma2 family endonuclease [Chloroflexi bacterium]|nr:Uma2 family endonuclease [Chloroflexota bacterium]